MPPRALSERCAVRPRRFVRSGDVGTIGARDGHELRNGSPSGHEHSFTAGQRTAGRGPRSLCLQLGSWLHVQQQRRR
jgi:hypothetical protein